MTPPMKEDVEVLRGRVRSAEEWSPLRTGREIYVPLDALSRILARVELSDDVGQLRASVDEIAAQGTTALSPDTPCPTGLRLVPEEPTPEMVSAWYRVKNGHHFHDEPPPSDTSDYAAYRAMLAAAPSPRSNPDDR